MRNWNDVTARILESGSSVQFETNRGGVTVPLGASRRRGSRVRSAIVLPPVIDTTFPGDPAAAAGILRGDSITSVAGHPVATWSEVVGEVTKSPGQPVTLAWFARRPTGDADGGAEGGRATPTPRAT